LRFYTLYILAFLAGCTPVSKKTAEDPDPFEPFNRKMFEFNRVVDGLVLEPFANLYKMSVHDNVRQSVSYFFYNLGEPITLTNDFLQGKKDRGFETFSRFMINTTFGLFGLFDVAEKLGLPRHQEDFGQTLRTWGVPSGPYLVLPLIGSTTPTNFAGRTVDFYLSPYNYYMVHYNKRQYIYMKLGLETLVKRAQYADDIKNFRENSIDFYAAVRSFYLQNQQAEMQNTAGTKSAAPSSDSFNLSDDDSDFLGDI
jgi:phospholipid-binding lipoprotein MlaA